MKKVEIQITQTFEERPTDVLKSLIGKTLDCIYTFNTALDCNLLEISIEEYEKLLFKTSDGFTYEVICKEYTEDCYLDIKKTSIELVEKIEHGFMEFQLPFEFFINKIFIFSLVQPMLAEKWHIEKVYGEKWHSEKRNIKFKEEFYPDVYIGQISEDSHLVFANEKGEFLSIGTQLSPYFKITNNRSYINDLFTGETWLKEGVPNPYKLSRTIE
jgi:hypothetical protein